MDTQLFTSEAGTTAYKQSKTGSPVGLFMVLGHTATFASRKWKTLEEFGRENNITTTGFIWYGWDQSQSNDVPHAGEGYIQHWMDQLLHMFDMLTTGPQILVGSSMGGYLALALAQARPDRVKGIVGIASGFGADLQQRIYNIYGEYRVGGSQEHGFSFTTHPDNSLPIVQELNIHCPIRLIHSISDDRVSYRNTGHIAEAVATDDIIIHLVKGPKHNDNRPEDAEWIKSALKELTAKAHPAA